MELKKITNSIWKGRCTNLIPQIWYSAKSNETHQICWKMYSCKDDSKQTVGIQQQGMVPISAVFCKT